MSLAENRSLGTALRSLEELAELTKTETTIVSIESFRSMIQPNVTHVLVTDSDGAQGLGETFYGSTAVEAHLHDVLIPTLISERPEASPTSVAEAIQDYVGYSGSGAEVRARSALDIALWDLAAKRAGQPLAHLLRPGSENRISSYNTCSGNNYVNAESRQSSSNWGFRANQEPKGDFEDLWAFLNKPGKLARELLDAGFTGMKVWPFDLAAERSRGRDNTDLSFGLSVLDEIRSAVGDEIQLYVELHSLWRLTAAEKLVYELEKYNLAWIEDPIRADSISDLAKLRISASMPIACGENLGSGVNGYQQLISQQAVDVLIMDLGWCGGITEALPVMRQSRDAGILTAYHDCTGPVSLAVATHVSLASENTSVQEVARAFWHGWYGQMAGGYPEIVDGDVRVSNSPGHGATLLPEFKSSETTLVRRSVLS